MKKVLVRLAVAVGVATSVFFGVLRPQEGSRPTARFRTAKVTKGEVVEGVQASGAVQPFLLVQVGTQVSGTIEKLFKDFNDPVKAGETIALLDSRRLVAQVIQGESNLLRARADLQRVTAQYRQAERELDRQRNLLERELATPQELDVAIANTEALRAQIDVAAAVVSQTVAQLEGDLVNLRYATIVSPVDGVIVSRNVDVGQTVAASLSTPTLFVIANDLTKVQVQASVPEADIGKITEGQRARFSVDAHPEQFFEGVVRQVRLASTTVQNVVTYTVLVDAANPKGLLLPGMTANVTFEIKRSPPDALRVPAAALRFKASEDQVDPRFIPKAVENGGPPHGSPHGARRERPEGEKRRGPPLVLFRLAESGLLEPVRVRGLVSDGVQTAVVALDESRLEEGVEVVTGVLKENEEPTTTNPFAPRMGGMRGGRRGPH